MPESFAEFLDDINKHIERELARVPPAVAESLLRSDIPLSTAEVLRILARSGKRDDGRAADEVPPGRRDTSGTVESGNGARAVAA